MTAASEQPTGLPGRRAPVGHPGLRWAGDGALVPPPAQRTRAGGPALDGDGERLAPSGAVLASFPRRCGGFIIDFLLISAIYALVLAMAFGNAEPMDMTRVDATWLPFVSTSMFIRLAYNWYFNRRGWSPGKRAWGLRLEGGDGAPPTLWRALGRALAAEVSLFLWLGYVWASWDRERRTWHDRLAATWVVRVPPAVEDGTASSAGR